MTVGEIPESEYRVLSDYIVGTFTGDKGDEQVRGRASEIVIVNKTESDRNINRIEDGDGKLISWKEITTYLQKQFPMLQRATLDSFRETNVYPASFKRSFQLPVPYELVDKAEIDAVFKHGGWWTDYYRKYPNSQGILSLSRVGFSPDGKQAVFYAGNMCGGKCGRGNYVVMERVDSGWKVAKEILFWIS
ncbi:MAG TPA: hypothetical protein VGT24_09155 [Candidatus Acidoferrales bacterium]|nr:hypothetical protein [Candidatus Acidoferrales bacterium]